MELKGQVEEIIFSNELNSYTVCSMVVGNNEITATGYLPFVNIGDLIVAEGDFINHNVYGGETAQQIIQDLATNLLSGYLLRFTTPMSQVLTKYVATGNLLTNIFYLIFSQSDTITFVSNARKVILFESKRINGKLTYVPLN